VLWDSGLPNVLTLVRRDLSVLLLWPTAYAIAAAVVVIVGYLMPALAGGQVTTEDLFTWTAVAMAVVTPVVTMRLLAEQRRSGTLDLLLASPVRFRELVAAKWLAGLLFFLATIAFTLLYVALFATYQPNVDSGAILTGYLGILLVGAAWVALGLLASSLTRNRFVAVVAGIAVLLALQYLLGTAAGFLAPPVSDLLDYASTANRAQAFERGQVVLRDAVYFLGLTAGALFLTARAVASRRWR
jgi:ABC-2 type transport system permease protein